MTLKTLLALNRGLALLGVIAFGILLIGPFQGLEVRLGMSDTVAHAVAFYLACLVAFVIAPNWRRTDLALAVFCLGAVAEVLQATTGRSASLLDILANSSGIALALLPHTIERLRQLTRSHPYADISELAKLDRRRHGRPLAGPKVIGQTSRSVRQATLHDAQARQGVARKSPAQT